MSQDEGMWTLEGWDTFSAHAYPLRGEFNSEAEARKAAAARLIQLEKTQPTASSGGQSGIQDRVYIISPTGERKRYLP